MCVKLQKHLKIILKNQSGKMYEHLILITIGAIILFLKLPFLLQTKYWINGTNDMLDIIIAATGIVFFAGGIFIGRFNKTK